MAINSLRRNPGLVCCPGADAYNLFSERELASQSLVAGHLMIVLLFPFGFCFTHAIRLSKDLLLLAGRGSTVSQNRRQGLNDRLEQRVYIIFLSTIISQINVMTIKEIQRYTFFCYYHNCMHGTSTDRHCKI